MVSNCVVIVKVLDLVATVVAAPYLSLRPARRYGFALIWKQLLIIYLDGELILIDAGKCDRQKDLPILCDPGDSVVFCHLPS